MKFSANVLKVILAISLVILIVIATIAYGNSKRSTNTAKNTSDSQQSTNKPDTQKSNQSPADNQTAQNDQSNAGDQTSGDVSDGAASDQAQDSPSGAVTTPVTPPSGTVPRTGGSLEYLLPIGAISILAAIRLRQIQNA